MCSLSEFTEAIKFKILKAFEKNWEKFYANQTLDLKIVVI